MSKIIRPVGVGYGRAGKVLEQAFQVLAVQHRDWVFEPIRWLKRGQTFPVAQSEDGVVPLALITTPHGLHAAAILDASVKGYSGILCEKPSCVNPEQVDRLRSVSTPTAILHGYRQTWGARTLRRLIETGELGRVFSMEGSYWQSSMADRRTTLDRGGNASVGWKDDPMVAGRNDVLLDIATHWFDFVTYLAGEKPHAGDVQLFYANSPSPHRDSHVWMDLVFGSGLVSRGSISKTVHGAQNEFQIHVLGERKRASWNFLRPDEIRIGDGRQETVLIREDSQLGTRHPAFHGAGWLDGYIEIARGLLQSLIGQETVGFPTLEENLRMMDFLLKKARPVTGPAAAPAGGGHFGGR